MRSISMISQKEEGLKKQTTLGFGEGEGEEKKYNWAEGKLWNGNERQP